MTNIHVFTNSFVFDTLQSGEPDDIRTHIYTTTHQCRVPTTRTVLVQQTFKTPVPEVFFSRQVLHFNLCISLEIKSVRVCATVCRENYLAMDRRLLCGDLSVRSVRAVVLSSVVLWLWWLSLPSSVVVATLCRVGRKTTLRRVRKLSKQLEHLDNVNCLIC